MRLQGIFCADQSVSLEPMMLLTGLVFNVEVVSFELALTSTFNHLEITSQPLPFHILAFLEFNAH